jgi:RND family efflux transporter MFP subunit
MPVTVVQIGGMRVRVHQGRVLVRMGVRLDTIPAVGVLMLVMLVAATLLLAGCDLPHGLGVGHDHDHDHDHETGHAHEAEHAQAHDDHDSHGHGHDQEADHGHGDDDDSGHDQMRGDHDEEHGHRHDPGAIAVTHFTEVTELFVEFPPLTVGEVSGFAAHLTRLEDFRPVAEGTVGVRLSGGGLPDEVFTVDAPSIPGIFRPVAVPEHAGERNVSLSLESPGLTATHDLGTYRVYPDQESALADQPTEEEAGEEISFLKEQQWKVDFATAEVERRPLHAAVRATGVIKPRKDGEAVVSAPTAGHLLASDAFPRIGTRVSAGQPLATILPKVAGDQVDVASLELAVERARSEHQFAEREHARLNKLVKQRAASPRDLNEAENAERVARAELVAATERLARYRRTLGSEGAPEDTGLQVRAPIAGTLAEILVTAGSYVEEGDEMFHIVDTDRLWLEASVAEADVGRLQSPQRAWFSVEGFERSFTVDPATGGQLVAFGTLVDPVRRTVPVLFELPNPERRLRVGMFADVRIATGESAEDTAVPVSAIVEEAGQDVVYVMLGGESFERRVVRLGIRDGDYVRVVEGVEPGERVVTVNAYLVRLAGASPAAAGHGHAH